MDEVLSGNSPVVGKTEEKLLIFAEAIKAILLGSLVSKVEWKDREIYGVLKDSHLKLHKSDGKFYDWIISEGDLIGLDYFIL